MTDYLVYDVFTARPFGGNQLAVIPDASALPEGDLQAIAREFNFSETTFVTPPADPAHTARVRIFTPTMEVPFAGHPTIGTAVALADLGHGPDMVLELGVGPLRAQATQGTASFTTEAAFRAGAAAHPGGLDFAQLAYVRDGARIAARMFAPLDNIPEDPATGSAAATLAALLAQITGRDQTLDYTQGTDMGRPSRITLTTQGHRVTVAGQARRVMEGRLVY